MQCLHLALHCRDDLRKCVDTSDSILAKRQGVPAWHTSSCFTQCGAEAAFIAMASSEETRSSLFRMICADELLYD